MASSLDPFHYQLSAQSPRIKITRSRYRPEAHGFNARRHQENQDLKVACHLLSKETSTTLVADAEVEGNVQRPASLLEDYFNQTGTGKTRNILATFSSALREQREQESQEAKDSDLEAKRRRKRDRLVKSLRERKTAREAERVELSSPRLSVSPSIHKSKKKTQSQSLDEKPEAKENGSDIVESMQDLEIQPPGASQERTCCTAQTSDVSPNSSGYWSTIRGAVMKKEMKIMQLMESVKRMKEKLLQNRRISCEDMAHDPLSKKALMTLRLVSKLKNKAVTTNNVFEEVQALLNEGETDEEQLVTTEEVGVSIAELLDFSLIDSGVDQLDLELDDLNFDFDNFLNNSLV